MKYYVRVLPEVTIIHADSVGPRITTFRIEMFDEGLNSYFLVTNNFRRIFIDF